MSEDQSYRMLIMLEDEVADSDASEVSETATEEAPARATHEFVDELILPVEIDDLDGINEWFDAFDADVCIPNEGFIKYEISSDGLVVLLLSRARAHVLDRIREFVSSHPRDL